MAEIIALKPFMVDNTLVAIAESIAASRMTTKIEPEIANAMIPGISVAPLTAPPVLGPSLSFGLRKKIVRLRIVMAAITATEDMNRNILSGKTCIKT